VNWSWADAWVLTAAYVTAENPVRLTSLIGAGDYINHAIFTDEELDHALTRLDAGGLAHLEGEVIVLTNDALRLCERAVDSTRYIDDGMKNVEAELRKIDLTGREFQPVEVSRSAVSAAVTQYHKSAVRDAPELGS
jgi:hypothetical protein